jgi:WD40 repeat protein
MQGIMSYGRGAISALKFSPSGSFILTAKDDFTICLWSIGNVYQRPMLRSFESHKGKVTDIDWLDDDVFASGGHDHTIFIFRTNDKRPRYTFKGHTDDVTKLKWSPTASTINKLGGASKEWEKRLLASVSDDGTCMVWKLPSYPEDRGTTSRSSSPTKMSNAGAIANGPGGSEKDDYFQGNGAVIGIDHCVNRLNVVTRSVNRRMDTLEWSPSCKDGRMILAA